MSEAAHPQQPMSQMNKNDQSKKQDRHVFNTPWYHLSNQLTSLRDKHYILADSYVLRHFHRRTRPSPAEAIKAIASSITDSPGADRALDSTEMENPNPRRILGEDDENCLNIAGCKTYCRGLGGESIFSTEMTELVSRVMG